MNSGFYNDLKSFYHEHKNVTIGTLGLAAVGVSLAKLAGRAITWIKAELFGTTKKVNDVQQTIIPRSPELDYYTYGVHLFSNNGRYAIQGPPNLTMIELKELIAQRLSILKAQNVDTQDLDLVHIHERTLLNDNLTWDEYANDFLGNGNTVERVLVVVKKNLPSPPAS